MEQITFAQKFLDMFPEDYIKTIPENATECGNCNGVGWHNKHEGFITLCNLCGGKGYIKPNICECGKAIERFAYTKCSDCRHKEFSQREHDKNIERYNKAKKIKFKDYKGMFWDDSWTHIKDSDDFAEWLADKIVSDEDYPTWFFATEKYCTVGIDIYDVVSNACEDGYEDMYDNLDTKSLQPIQEMIDKWILEQGDSVYSYTEDYKLVVELDDLIEEIKSDMRGAI